MNSGLGVKRTLLFNLIPISLSFIGFVAGVLLDKVDESYDDIIFAVSSGMYFYIFLGTLVYRGYCRIGGREISRRRVLLRDPGDSRLRKRTDKDESRRESAVDLVAIVGHLLRSGLHVHDERLRRRYHLVIVREQCFRVIIKLFLWDYKKISPSMRRAIILTIKLTNICDNVLLFSGWNEIIA